MPRRHDCGGAFLIQQKTAFLREDRAICQKRNE